MRGRKTIGRIQQHRERSRGAFTLIEGLVVIAIVAILASLLFSALSKAKEQGSGTVCRSNLRQVCLAMAMFSDDNDGFLPWAPSRADRNLANDFVFGGPGGGSMDLLDPSSWDNASFAFHAESGSIFSYVTSQPRVTPHKDDNPAVVPAFRCPSSGALGEALRVNFSMNGWFDPSNSFASPRGVQATEINSPAQKVLVVNEVPAKMSSAAFSPDGAGGRSQLLLHVDRANIGFVDTHVESIPERKVADMLAPRFRDLWFHPTK